MAKRNKFFQNCYKSSSVKETYFNSLSVFTYKFESRITYVIWNRRHFPADFCFVINGLCCYSPIEYTMILLIERHLLGLYREGL